MTTWESVQEFLSEPTTWSGPDSIWARLGEHIWVSVAAVMIAALVFAPALRLVGPAVVAVVVEPAALRAARLIVLMRSLAPPPRVAVAAAILLARSLALFVLPSTWVVILHSVISFL